MLKEIWKSLKKTRRISTGKGRAVLAGANLKTKRMKEPGGSDPAGRDLKSLGVGEKTDFVASCHI